MRKDDQSASLTFVGVALCVSLVTQLLLLNAINKGTTLTWLLFASSSAALLVTLVLLEVCSTTKKQAGSNRLHHLAQAEKRIAAGPDRKKTSDSFWLDEWERLNEVERKDWFDAHGPWCDGYCCMDNRKNLYYKR